MEAVEELLGLESSSSSHVRLELDPAVEAGPSTSSLADQRLEREGSDDGTR